MRWHGFGCEIAFNLNQVSICRALFSCDKHSSTAVLCHCFVFRSMRLNCIFHDVDDNGYDYYTFILIMCTNAYEAEALSRGEYHRPTLIWRDISIPPSLARYVNVENAADENSFEHLWKSASECLASPHCNDTTIKLSQLCRCDNE